MKHVRRIETPDHIAESANGTGPYVEVKTRIKGKYSNALLDFSMSLMKVNRIDETALTKANEAEGDDNPAELSAYALVEEMSEKKEALYAVYAELITDWNWLDPDTGEALPKPHQNPGVFRDELDQSQMAYINEVINEAMKYRATEGNGTTPTASKSGRPVKAKTRRTGSST